MPTSLPQEPADAAHSLVDALLILHQSKTDKLIAILPKANAGAHSNLVFLQQLLRKLQRSHRLVLVRNRRPHKHGGFWFLNCPAGAVQTVTQHIATTAVNLDNFPDAFLGAAQSGDGSNLNRLERSVVQIAFHARQGMNHFAIADTKAHAPTWHAVALRQREELDCPFPCSWNLHNARGFVAVEDQVGISEIVNHQHLVLLSKLDNPLEERQFHDLGSRVGRKSNDQQFWHGPQQFDATLQFVNEVVTR